jgi:F-type H+-transporting ATPase subunit epsilon
MANGKDLIKLTVVSQERQLLSEMVESVTAPALEGEVTILPDHIPLFSPLQAGILTYRNGGESQIVVSKGFIDVGVDNNVTVIVDTAVHARDVSLEKAEAAIKAAQTTMSTTQDRRELLLAEASLKQALLEIKVARATKKASI